MIKNVREKVLFCKHFFCLKAIEKFLKLNEFYKK